MTELIMFLSIVAAVIIAGIVMIGVVCAAVISSQASMEVEDEEEEMW